MNAWLRGGVEQGANKSIVCDPIRYPPKLYQQWASPIISLIFPEPPSATNPYDYMRYVLFMLSILTLFGCKTYPPLETVAEVDLARYAGKWYEIASIPTSFQKGCHCTTAEYELKDGYVRVINTCRKNSVEGEIDRAKGKAFVVDGSNNARLKVQFFWPFRGDYYIIDLAEDYSYAMVGAPNRNYLWLLSRTPALPQATIDQLKVTAQRKGFDPNRLRFTEQDNCQ